MTSEGKMWAIMAVLIAGLLALCMWLDYMGCGSRWEDSGRRYVWSAFGGCRVEDKQGRLIPEKNIRDMQ